MPMIPGAGQAPPPSPGGGDLPPELMQMMMGGQGGPPPGMPPEIPDPAQQQGGGDPSEEIGAMLERLSSLAEANGMTQQERLSLEKIRTEFQKLLAQWEKEEQAALGGGPATSFLRRQSG